MNDALSARETQLRRRVRQWSRAWLVGLLFVVGLFAVGVAFPLFGLLPARIEARARDWVQTAWYASLLRVLRVRVAAHGRSAQEAGLCVANHLSWLDIVVLGAHRPLIFVAKSEVGEWPLVGFMARRIGTLLVRRGDIGSSRAVAERMTRLLRERRSVALFPEGTSTDGAQVLRFHPRLFGPAVRAGTPVQAIAIAYRGQHAMHRVPFVGDDEFLPHLWRVLELPQIEAELSFCPPVAAGAIGRDASAELTRQQIVQSLAIVESPDRAMDGLQRSSA